MNPSDDFTAVPLESFRSNPCSPVWPRSGPVLGIRIRAPSRVSTASPFQIPLCGAYSLPAKELPPGGVLELEALVRGPLDGTLVVSLAPPDAPPPEPRVPLSDAGLAGLRVGGYFNADLVAHAPIAWEPGVYRIRVRLGKVVSNQVAVEVVAEGEAGGNR